MTHTAPRRFSPRALAARLWFASWLGLCSLLATGAWAQQDPPGRVGRLAELQGAVFWWDHETGRWDPAVRNHPLTGGDRVSTGPDGRAELSVGSTVLRIGAGTELEVLRLDDERMAFQLHSGKLALRLRSREVAEQIEVDTAEVRLLPERAGHYRIGRLDDVTQAGVWRGDLRVDDPAGFVITTGQNTELTRGGPGLDPATLRRSFATLPGDAFANWVLTADERAERTASSEHVSPEMTGAEDLDRSGHWSQHPDYGAVWEPDDVGADWAPYRYGSWAWVQPWGWTWVDQARWGFAPFHYGRWVYWRDRWAWAPGARVVRPVYAPALVGFVGNVSIGVGGGIAYGRPPSAWVPLGPREAYAPWYRYGPRYWDRINTPPPYRWHDDHRGRRPGPQPTGPIAYDNQGVPSAVTVVPRDALQRPGRVPVPAPSSGRTRPQPPPGASPVIGAPAPRSRGPREPGFERDRDRERGGDHQRQRDPGPRGGREHGSPNQEPQMGAPLQPGVAPPRGREAPVAPAVRVAPPPSPPPAPLQREPRPARDPERGLERRPPPAEPREPAAERKQRPEPRPSMRDRESSR